MRSTRLIPPLVEWNKNSNALSSKNFSMKLSPVIFSATAVSLLMAALPFLTSAEDIKFNNPLKAADLPKLIDSVVAALTPLAITAASLLIMIAGFKYIIAVSGGQADPAKKAKELFVPALELALIIAAGSVILKAVIEFVKKFSQP